MPYSSEHRCLFVHIPRTGGTSIEKVFNFNSGKQHLNGVFRLRTNGLNLIYFQLQHLTALQAFQLRGEKTFSDCFKFAFVRNPWDRVVSDYENWYKKYFNTFEDYVLVLKKIGSFIEENFSHNIHSKFYKQYAEFVYQYIGERFWVDPHFFPQHYFIFDQSGKEMLDFVGRFEEYNQSWTKIATKLNLEIQPQKFNASRRLSSYHDYYNTKTQDIIGNLYAQDIEKFGYLF